MREKRRSFGGKISGFVDKFERRFEKKHLAAYLKGWERFQMGRDWHKNPIYHKVKEVWQ